MNLKQIEPELKVVNRLCPSCLERCKQSPYVIVVNCKFYRPRTKHVGRAHRMPVKVPEKPQETTSGNIRVHTCDRLFLR